MQNFNHLKYLSILTSLIVLSSSAIVEASPILQSDFSSSATVLDTTTFANGATTITTNDLTLTGGTNLIGLPGFSYLDISGNGPTTIKLQFNGAVAALGVQFISNNTPVTLSVFNSLDVLLESYTMSNIGLPSLSNSIAFPTGFVALNESDSIINYATISTGLGQNSVYIGNITYGALNSVPAPAAVPLPGAAWLFGSALLGSIGLKRRKNIG
ncbi:hypothetical protein [Methylobacter psychrophilus]|uniref:hypothetical protein n=1 Tax=Methylobacter psychrophilus TaxID=96941 RepID=UPI0021D4BEF0|nr:hypothetical protein [Methylobacter psychrophilus]